MLFFVLSFFPNFYVSLVINMTNVSLRTTTAYNSVKCGDDENAGVITKNIPEKFLISMRKLFDILDTRNVGLVRMSEIERQWREDAVPNLPGVLDSLRSIAPEDGLINFETFVWGLKIALAKARNNGHNRLSIASELETMPTDDAEGRISNEQNLIPPLQKAVCSFTGRPSKSKVFNLEEFRKYISR